MAADKSIFNGAFPPQQLRRLLERLDMPHRLCAIRQCRRGGRCDRLYVDTGESICLERLVDAGQFERLVALCAADAWLLHSLAAGLPAPFREWPAETVGPRLSACLELATGGDFGPQTTGFRRWWRDCRAAALSAGWSAPPRPAAAAGWPPFEPPAGPRSKPLSGPPQGGHSDAAPAVLQPSEMAQPPAARPENTAQTLDLKGLCGS